MSRSNGQERDKLREGCERLTAGRRDFLTVIEPTGSFIAHESILVNTAARNIEPVLLGTTGCIERSCLLHDLYAWDMDFLIRIRTVFS